MLPTGGNGACAFQFSGRAIVESGRKNRPMEGWREKGTRTRELIRRRPERLAERSKGDAWERKTSWHANVNLPM